MKKHILFLSTAVLLLLASCDKDKDETLPQVTFLLPSSDFNTYTFQDDINVRLAVNDDQALQLLTVRIEHNGSNAILGVQNKSLSGSSDEVLLLFPFDNIHLPGGTYTISATVEDAAGNTKSAFRELSLFEVPLERESIGILRSSGNSLSVDTLNSSGTFNPAWSSTGTFSTLFMSSYFQELLVGEADNATIQFVNTQTWQNESGFQITSGIGEDQIRDIVFDRDRLLYYAAFFEGPIRILGENGVQKGSIDLPMNYRPVRLSVNENILLVQAAQVGSNNQVLIQYNAFTGIIEQTNAIAGELYAIVPFESGFLLFRGEGGNVELERYSSNGFITNLPWLVSDEAISEVIPLESGFYAVAHEDGVYLHQFGTSVFFSGSNNGIEAQDLAFDPVGNQLYALDGAALHQIGLSSGSIIQSFGVPADAQEVFIQLNK